MVPSRMSRVFSWLSIGMVRSPGCEWRGWRRYGLESLPASRFANGGADPDDVSAKIEQADGSFVQERDVRQQGTHDIKRIQEGLGREGQSRGESAGGAFPPWAGVDAREVGLRAVL